MSHIILGASGHVGSALADELLRQGELVTVVLRDKNKAANWEQKGANVAIADVHDSDTLRRVFRQGKRVFLLNPPAPPSTDICVEERKSVFSIVAALDGSGLEKVVAQSTYGAQPGERSGDLSVLYELEQALAAQPIPFSIIRGAYYMSNWDAYLKMAEEEDKIASFYPVGFQLPMVAPQDIGQFAARLMTEPVENCGLHNIEGPQTYSVSDVAAAFSSALNKPVRAEEIPHDQWKPTLVGMGFSEAAADSFVIMTEVTLKYLSDKQHTT